jgi:hypothetical protein
MATFFLVLFMMFSTNSAKLEKCNCDPQPAPQQKMVQGGERTHILYRR